MGRSKKRSRGGGGDMEDQYGEAMVSQDRGERLSSSGRGGSFSGGGEAEAAGLGQMQSRAGGAGRKDSDIHVVRSVPKFLQGHMHLLGRKPPQEEEEAQLATVDESEQQRKDDDADEQEALQRAVAENPDLAEQYPELQPVAQRARAGRAKEAGNRAFAAKDYESAVRHFTEAITLHEDPVYLSNRAAAYHGLKQFRKAADDAKRVVALDSQWVKGWSRLAAAHFALEEWSEAKEAYDTAIKLEPDDNALQSMRHKAEVNEAKQEADKVVKFKQSRQKLRQDGPRGQSNARPAKKDKRLLSFDEEDD